MVYTADMKKEKKLHESPLATRLYQLMDKTGVNKSGLARVCGITPQSVGKWFQKGSISKDSAIKLSETFGVSLSWLLGEGETSDLVLEEDFAPAALTETQKKLLELFERLPESEKKHHLAALQDTVENYDRLFDELLKSRKIKELRK